MYYTHLYYSIHYPIDILTTLIRLPLLWSDPVGARRRRAKTLRHRAPQMPMPCVLVNRAGPAASRAATREQRAGNIQHNEGTLMYFFINYQVSWQTKHCIHMSPFPTQHPAAPFVMMLCATNVLHLCRATPRSHHPPRAPSAHGSHQLPGLHVSCQFWVAAELAHGT